MIRFNFVPGFFPEKINLKQPVLKWTTVQSLFFRYTKKVIIGLRKQVKNPSFKKMRD
jgi:hypothetical protein